MGEGSILHSLCEEIAGFNCITGMQDAVGAPEATDAGGAQYRPRIPENSDG